MRRRVRVSLFIVTVQAAFVGTGLGQGLRRNQSASQVKAFPARQIEIEDRTAAVEERKAEAALRQAVADEKRAKTEDDKLAIESRQVTVTTISAAVTLMVAFGGLAFSNPNFLGNQQHGSLNLFSPREFRSTVQRL